MTKLNIFFYTSSLLFIVSAVFFVVNKSPFLKTHQTNADNSALGSKEKSVDDNQDLKREVLDGNESKEEDNSRDESNIEPVTEKFSNRSDLKIQVQNGNGGVGAASNAAKILEAKGYPEISTRDADSFSYEESMIKVKNDKNAKDISDTLLKDFNDQYSFSVEKTLPGDSKFDAIVIIGLE